MPDAEVAASWVEACQLCPGGHRICPCVWLAMVASTPPRPGVTGVAPALLGPACLGISPPDGQGVRVLHHPAPPPLRHRPCATSPAVGQLRRVCVSLLSLAITTDRFSCGAAAYGQTYDRPCTCRPLPSQAWAVRPPQPLRTLLGCGGCSWMRRGQPSPPHVAAGPRCMGCTRIHAHGAWRTA